MRVSDWGANPIRRFDPESEKFDPFPPHDPYPGAQQLARRKGEVWGKLFVLKPE